jgi:hypothetical protein
MSHRTTGLPCCPALFDAGPLDEKSAADAPFDAAGSLLDNP